MSIATVTLNGTPVENYGLQLSDLTGWLDVAPRDFAPVTAPVRPGQIPLSTGSSMQPRSLGLKFYVQPSSLKDRRDKLSALFAQLSGQLEISTIEDPTKVCYGYLTGAQTSSPFRPLLSPEVYSDVALTCFDPLWYDREPQMYGSPSSGTRVVLPIGSAPIRRLRYIISGAGGVATNPVVILRSANGAERQRMTLTVGIGTNDYVVIDCDAYTITKFTAGVPSAALSALASTESFFVIDDAGASMTLETSLGTLDVHYWRAYWS